LPPNTSTNGRSKATKRIRCAIVVSGLTLLEGGKNEAEHRGNKKKEPTEKASAKSKL